MKLLKIALLLGTAYYLLNSLLYTWLPTNYIFDAKTLNEISNSVISKYDAESETFDVKVMLKDLRDALAKHYGDDYINQWVDEEWAVSYTHLDVYKRQGLR